MQGVITLSFEYTFYGRTKKKKKKKKVFAFI
jgi:hypothetical protein